MAWYLDTSALVKLVVAEEETPSLLTWLSDDRGPLVSSDLARTELLRVVQRAEPDRAVQARLVLDSLVLLRVTSAICEAAGLLAPAALRSLDAVHLASALALGDDLDGIVTYDARLADAGRRNGVVVIAPD